MKIIIPLPQPRGGTSQIRQKFIQKAEQYLPERLGNLIENSDKKYSADVVFYNYGISNIDIDNSIKALFDAIKGRLLPDDRQIKKLTVEIKENTKKAEIHISLNEI